VRSPKKKKDEGFKKEGTPKNGDRGRARNRSEADTREVHA